MKLCDEDSENEFDLAQMNPEEAQKVKYWEQLPEEIPPEQTIDEEIAPKSEVFKELK